MGPGHEILGVQTTIQCNRAFEDGLLAEEIEYDTALLAEEDLSTGIDKMATDVASEDPNEEFYRLMDFTAKRSCRRTSRPVEWKTHSAPSVGCAKARMITATIGWNQILQIGEALDEIASSTIEECDEMVSLINTRLNITETEPGHPFRPLRIPIDGSAFAPLIVPHCRKIISG